MQKGRRFLLCDTMQSYPNVHAHAKCLQIYLVLFLLCHNI